MATNDDLIAEAIKDYAKSLTISDYRSNGCLNVGELILLLENVDEGKTIGFVDGSFPKEFGSYRGSYSELGIEYDEGTPLLPETVGLFLLRLKDMIGKTIYGYKGGEYTVTEKTTVHKANYGECGDIVVGIKEYENSVDILTRDEDDDDLDGEYESKCKLKKLKDTVKSKPKEEMKDVSPEDLKKWDVDFVRADGVSVGTTEFTPSEEECTEPTCEMEDWADWCIVKEHYKTTKRNKAILSVISGLKKLIDAEIVARTSKYAIDGATRDAFMDLLHKASRKFDKAKLEQYQNNEELKQLPLDMFFETSVTVMALSDRLSEYIGLVKADLERKDSLKELCTLINDLNIKKLRKDLKEFLIAMYVEEGGNG